MRNAYWASTHPAWTPSGYKCLCGNLFKEQEDLYAHVFTDHNDNDASNILSAKQYRRYQWHMKRLASLLKKVKEE